jgi:hypothetical protein
MWRLSIPASVSITGKQVRRWFDSKTKALTEVKRLTEHQKQVGSSAKLLDAARIIEASDCWDELDKAFQSLQSQPTPPGTLKRIVQQEIKLMQQRAKSISLDQLFSSYNEKLLRMHRTDNYREQYRWLKGYFDWTIDKRVSDLTVSDINVAFSHLPAGNRNSNTRLLRALLSWAVKNEWAKSNVASQIEFIHQPKQDIQPPLPNDVNTRLLMQCTQNMRAAGTSCGPHKKRLIDNDHPKLSGRSRQPF